MPIRYTATLAIAIAALSSAHAQEFKIAEKSPVAKAEPGKLTTKLIAFNDTKTDELAEANTGLIPFEEWSRWRPIQKQFLSLYPGYVEPTIQVRRNGVLTPVKEKLHVFEAEARFLIAKPAQTLDPARYATLAFVQKLDPAIQHKPIKSSDAIAGKEPRFAANQNPDRKWCEGRATALCVQSHYKLEGRLPTGVQLANKLRDQSRKIADYVEFQSEISALPRDASQLADVTKLTGLDTPVAGALEQSIFYVNELMKFGKILVVFQQHPTDQKLTVVTAFLVLGVDSNILGKNKEFEKVPVLRNLVPAQVLAGNSSFNTGNSISAGLPKYARNQIMAIAQILERE